MRLCRARDSSITSVCQLVGLLAMQSDFRQAQHRKTQEAILCKLVSILEAAPESPLTRTSSNLNVIFRHVCEAMTSVLRDQKEAKKVIHNRGGIPLLVRLLNSTDSKVQRASTSVLRTLAFKEDDAKNAIVDAGAVAPLIRMLRSEVLNLSKLLKVPCAAGRHGDYLHACKSTYSDAQMTSCAQHWHCLH